MVHLTQSLQQWLYTHYPDKIGLIVLGHTELYTAEMHAEYLEWCGTEDGKQYLIGGSKYKDDEPPLKLGYGIPTADDCAEAAINAAQALRDLAAAAKESTVAFNAIGGNKRLLWRMSYDRPHRWPVSNNWLKMHGYPMRRRGCR